ncbi:VOC family protein [Leptolyngbya sp. KIOST-1]|uniref:SMU1112c/YaeR family gloxylase I-like metalloprotein n=1 Tax=Leptolyngbya sp. KIOST-1 TaxID=1229172 RepID=UPI0005680798|nr:VOC family protein [Leptolyngbya sp. KIOST-1]
MSLFHGIHHIAIICGDYPRSKRFYTQVLGFEVIRETYRAERQSYKLDLSLADGTQIELFSFPCPPPRPSRPEAQGLRHLALEVTNLEAAIQHLHGQGVATEAIRLDPFTGRRFVFFQDPDQLPIELYER